MAFGVFPLRGPFKVGYRIENVVFFDSGLAAQYARSRGPEWSRLIFREIIGSREARLFSIWQLRYRPSSVVTPHEKMNGRKTLFSCLEEELREARRARQDDTLSLLVKKTRQAHFKTLCQRADDGSATAVKGIVLLSETYQGAQAWLNHSVSRQNDLVCRVLQGFDVNAVRFTADRSSWGLRLMGLVAAAGHRPVREMLVSYASRWLDATCLLVTLSQEGYSWAETALRELTFGNQITIVNIKIEEATDLVKTLRRLGNSSTESIRKFLRRNGFSI